MKHVREIARRGRRFFGVAAAAVGCTFACHAAAPSPPSGPPVPVDRFPEGEVLRLAVEIPEESLRSLKDDPRAYVKATLRDGEAVLPNVGIRLKGSAGSFQAFEEKPGFTVKANQFAPAQRFRGLRKLLLNNGAQDQTYLCEAIGYELFRAAGVPAPRTAYARLSVNGRDLGLYVVVESTSTDFLARHFKDATGNLYEGPGDVADEIDVDSGGPAADRSDLRSLANAAEEPDLAIRLLRLEKTLDIDRFLSFMAVETIAWHWDGYAMAANNYRVYDEPTTGCHVFLPHGADQLFGETATSFEPPLNALVARAVLEIPELRARYRVRVAELLRGPIAARTIRDRIVALSQRIRPALAEVDAGLPAAHAEATAQLVDRIGQRLASIEDQLAGRYAPPEPPPEPAPLVLAFDERGVARLSGWQPRGDAGEAKIEEADEAGKPVLLIAAREDAGCVASWRTKVLVPAGRYRFTGRLRVDGVAPTADDDGPGSGVCLRISGERPQASLLGDAPWTAVSFEFAAAREGDDGGAEPGFVEKQLVCELRGSRGEARFDRESLLILRADSSNDR